MLRFPWLRTKPNTGPPLQKLRETVERHLGVELSTAESLSHDIKPIDRINLQKVIDQWVEESHPDARVFGYSAREFMADDGLIRHLVTDGLIQAPFERVRIESGPHTSMDCAQRGLYLLHHDQTPMVLGIRPARFLGENPTLEIIGPHFAATRNTLTALLEQAQKNNIHKGCTLSLERARRSREGFAIRFHELPATAREQIVLPEELLSAVERNVLGMIRHADTLRAAGRSLKRGLLFHGPPGTGKTMVVRYLASECKDHTVILLTGAQQGLIPEACDVARLLAPSIVVLEDVDLIAEDRDHNRCSAVLHELLNEMDGLLGRDEVTFLLTTNRPEVIETALSARPGRVDQAVAFPLPDEHCRRRLFEVYGQGLDLSAIDLPRWVAQTGGVSPAFIEELLRKAVLVAAERGETSDPLKLSDADIQNAIRELVYFGGELTQKLLGYRPVRIGYQASTEAMSPNVST